MNQRYHICRIWFSMILAGCLIGNSITVFAESDFYQAVDGNQVSDERLQDQMIEYEELGSLIHANNIDVQNIESSSENRRQEYTEIRDYLRSERSSAGREKDEAKDDGDMESYAEYASYEVIYKSAIKSYNKMIERLDKYSSNKGRITLEKQLTNAAQSLMISYQSLSLQKEYLSKMEELLRTQYENIKLQQSVGLATEQDIYTAYNNWSEINISLNSLETSEDSIYQNLCLLLGVDETGNMEIQRIPSVDLQQIEEINLEEDIRKAISNNLDVVNTRNTSAGGSSSANKKRRTLNELEEKVTVKMKELYDRIQQLKTAYDAAQSGYQSAQIAWNNAESRYQLGMLGKAEYLLEEMQFIQKKAGFESADLELLQALETYQWAIRGIVSVD